MECKTTHYTKEEDALTYSEMEYQRREAVENWGWCTILVGMSKGQKVMKRIICILLMIVGILYSQSIEEQNNIITKNVDEMKKFLYEEYKLKRKYIKRKYPNSHVKYFELIEYENYPSLNFSFPISKNADYNGLCGIS